MFRDDAHPPPLAVTAVARPLDKLAVMRFRNFSFFLIIGIKAVAGEIVDDFDRLVVLDDIIPPVVLIVGAFFQIYDAPMAVRVRRWVVRHVEAIAVVTPKG